MYHKRVAGVDSCAIFVKRALHVFKERRKFVPEPPETAYFQYAMADNHRNLRVA